MRRASQEGLARIRCSLASGYNVVDIVQHLIGCLTGLRLPVGYRRRESGFVPPFYA